MRKVWVLRIMKKVKWILTAVAIVGTIVVIFDFLCVNYVSGKMGRLDGMSLYSFDDIDAVVNGYPSYCSIAWHSEDQSVLSESGIIYRKDYESCRTGIEIEVRGLICKKSKELHVIAMPIYENSPFIMGSLKRVIDFSEKSIQQSKRVVSRELTLLEEAIESGKETLEKRALTDAEGLCDEIIRLGGQYFRIAGKDGRRGSSENDLTGLIWEAKAELLVEPEVYTKAAKEALQYEIECAESVLDGTFIQPYSRNRDFVKEKEENTAQFARRHYSSVSDYMMSDGGLEPVLEWYRGSNKIYSFQNCLTINAKEAYSVLPADKGGGNFGFSSANRRKNGKG